jgi:glutamate-ammonia-ligase adenylyltransferase
MEAAFSSMPFAERERARSNLRLIQGGLPANLWNALPTLLAQVPDPDGALNYLERYVRPENAGGSERLLSYLSQNPAALHYILVVFSYSRFLSETVIQQPELAIWLHRPTQRHSLERLKSRDDLQEEFARFEATAFDSPPAVVLARFKRREYLRIMLRDVLGIATLADTTLELSRLADVLLDRARRICEHKLQNTYGTPRVSDAEGRLQPAHVAVLSLGKLGAQELNYSSDIDVMFLYDLDGETSGGTAGVTSNAEYFIRLAQAILGLVTEVTPEGAVFRVDLRLRPQGAEGDLAISLLTALDYYRNRAREWELQMLIKARCSTGDSESARRFLRELQPLIYKPEINFAAVEAVLNARAGIARELRRSRGRAEKSGHAAEWNVKLSPGGIRDIEFLAQCLQRVYGGADAWLAHPSTLVALQRLHDKGHLSSHDFSRLGSAYEFLRRVEHRLQLRDGLQRHTLPEAPDALCRLARRCGIEVSGERQPGEELLRRIGRHFADVREIYERLVRPRSAVESEPVATTPAETRATEPGEGALLRRLRREYPGLAQAVGEVAARSESYARRGLYRFLSSAMLDPEIMKQLGLHARWVAQAAELFARSDLMAEMLARHPDEIGVLADPGLAGFRGPIVASAGGMQEGMAALRVAYRRAVIATVVRALTSRSVGATEPFATCEILSRLAEEAIAGAITLAARDVTGKEDLADAPFAVLALGRLGTREMDIGSDADLVFIADDRLSAEQREIWRRLAERFVHVASSHTREGLLFPVDTRLRPGGTEGEIVQTVAYLRDYFRTEAQGWEAATYLKARPVAGNMSLGARAVAQVHAELTARFRDAPQGPAELARQLIHTRERLEKESTGPRAKGEFKKLSGGYYDVEYLVAFLTLTRVQTAPEPSHILRQIAALEGMEIIGRVEARALRSGALLYRGLDHALRLITGHPAKRLPEPALAERVAALLHQWGVPVEGTLEAAVARARQQVRALYEKTVVAAAEAPGN